MLSLLLQQSLGSGREFHDKTSVWQSTLAALWYWVARQRLVPEITVMTLVDSDNCFDQGSACHVYIPALAVAASAGAKSRDWRRCLLG